jgi:serine protease Do
MKTFARWTALLAASISILPVSLRAQQATDKPEPARSVPSAPASRAGAIASYAPIVEQVNPSVVTVFTSKKMQQNALPSSLFGDPRVRRFFGDQFPGSDTPQKLQGLGSGVIVSTDGFILTANHVVEGADEILIGLTTGTRKYHAQKIGGDLGTDIALLKVDGPKDLHAVEFADSDKARPGDIVLALGAPYGLQQTVTSGIISAVGRGGMGIVDYENFIQTDAAINMGNSGGALIDTQGRLVGINSAIFSRSGGNQGIGFAIPSNLARDVMQSLRQNGRVKRGYIGTAIQTLTPELADGLNLKEGWGALVGEVTPNSPADTAGIKSGDVITGVNGKRINDARELRLVIGSMPPGTEVKLGVNRDGVTKEMTLKLAEMPADQAEPTVPPARPDLSTNDKPVLFGGVAVADVDNDVRETLKLPKNVEGAVIVSIDPSSTPAAAGLRVGDVIRELNKQPVKNAKELAAITQKMKPHDNAVLRIWRDGHTGYVAIEAPNS